MESSFGSATATTFTDDDTTGIAGESNRERNNQVSA
jgi:hypothetical protein